MHILRNELTEPSIEYQVTMRFNDHRAQFFVLAHCFMWCVTFLLSLLSSQILDHIWRCQTPVSFGIILCKEIYQHKDLLQLLQAADKRYVPLQHFLVFQHVHAQNKHFIIIDITA